jgi:hypothetical protein
MSKAILFQKCEELGIKDTKNKTKNQLLALIRCQVLTKKSPFQDKDQKFMEYKYKFDDVIKQLLSCIPKDKRRKVCDQCHDLGHNKLSQNCKININFNNILKYKIKKYILSEDCLNDKTIDEHCEDISIILNISPNKCKTIYNEIPIMELFDRYADIDLYFKNIKNLNKTCSQCNNIIINIQNNTCKTWKKEILCDKCWCMHSNCRNLLWQQIKAYKLIQCNVCLKIQTFDEERFHYDHLNMFNKGESICNMVNEGYDIKEIYNEIDKCQILCLNCHHIITNIERKFNFIRFKCNLKIQLNNNEITEPEMDETMLKCQHIYDEKMNQVYNKLNSFLNEL